MTSEYEQASEALYQAAHESFVAKRQELARQLKATGDKLAAARLSKLPRPSISAWAVNQLWWHERSAFDALFETAEQVRAGRSPAGGAHRQAVSKLTAHAKQLLQQHEHTGSEATLRRITMTLSALAASGGFDPERPGMLTRDLDPPGFEALELADNTPSEPAGRAEHEAHAKVSKLTDAKAKQRAADEAERARELAQEAAAAEKARLVALRAKRAAEKLELESALYAAQTALAGHLHEHERAERALRAAEQEVARARSTVEAAEAKLEKHSSD